MIKVTDGLCVDGVDWGLYFAKATNPRLIKNWYLSWLLLLLFFRFTPFTPRSVRPFSTFALLLLSIKPTPWAASGSPPAAPPPTPPAGGGRT